MVRDAIAAIEVAAREATDPATAVDAMIDAAATEYRRIWADAELMVFEHRQTHFLFDTTPSRDRTVFAVREPSPPESARDVSYQRVYPLPDSPTGRPVDRGHFIPFTAGGDFGPNLYVQDRALNRGWSREGRQYRALERQAVTAGQGTLLAAQPHYIDDSAVPAFVTLLVTNGKTISTGTYRNRFDADATAGADVLDIMLSGATDAQIGALGEETTRVLLEEQLDATIIAQGDAAMERDGGRQDLDLLVVLDGELTAIEVKTRYTSARAGRTTRAGNLPRPRLRQRGLGPRQGSQPYVRDRLSHTIDTEDQYDGINVLVVTVDLVLMLAQVYQVDDAGRRLTQVTKPLPCREAARTALDQILHHRGYL